MEKWEERRKQRGKVRKCSNHFLHQFKCHWMCISSKGSNLNSLDLQYGIQVKVKDGNNTPKPWIFRFCFLWIRVPAGHKKKKKSGNVPAGKQGDFKSHHSPFLLHLSHSIISDVRTKRWWKECKCHGFSVFGRRPEWTGKRGHCGQSTSGKNA